MYPHERSLVKRLEGKPFVLLGINSDGDLAQLKKRMAEEKITWQCWSGKSTDGPISKAWNVRGWPTTYVLDAKGVIRDKEVRDEEMDKSVDKLLKEMGVNVEPATQPARQANGGSS